MNIVSIFLLKALRKLYLRYIGGDTLPALQKNDNVEEISDLIYNILSSNQPCMIARFGSTELATIVNYIGITSTSHSIIKFIKGSHPEWWWNSNIMQQMQQWSGFFPPTPEYLSRFSKMMLNDAKEINILGSWLQNEYYIKDYLVNAQKVNLLLMEPFWSKNPWTRILKNKKVLVIHPFAETIQKQYQKREFLFSNKDILPEFELYTIKAVQSLGGSNSFQSWFEALKWMKNEMDKIQYDICLIGCGAYGLPLAAHAKRNGKKAVHLGGSLQLLFGIRGKRWENPQYGIHSLKQEGAYTSLINKYWCRASENERPSNASAVENGCYW